MIKKVLLLWYQEEDNFGDILLYRTTRDYLYKRGIDVFSCEVGEPCVDIIKKANSTDFLLFAGGGIIESGVPNVIRFFAEDYHLLNVPYGVIGLGVADYDYSAFSYQLSFWINNAQFFYVRDDYSKRRLDELFETSKVCCSADCVLYNRELLKYGTSTGNDVGINLRDLPFKHISGDFNSQVLRMVYEKCGIGVVLPDASDEQLSKIVKKKEDELLGYYDKLDSCEKVEVTINEIRRCQYVIAMRFHVILVSAILGIIPIPIIYHQKVRSLVTELGLGEIAVELNEIDKIPEKLDKARKNENAYKKNICDNISRLRGKVDEMYKEIEAFFIPSKIGE